MQNLLPTDRLNAYSTDEEVQAAVEQTVALLQDEGYDRQTAQALATNSASIATNRSMQAQRSVRREPETTGLRVRNS